MEAPSHARRLQDAGAFELVQRARTSKAIGGADQLLGVIRMRAHCRPARAVGGPRGRGEDRWLHFGNGHMRKIGTEGEAANLVLRGSSQD